MSSTEKNNSDYLETVAEALTSILEYTEVQTQQVIEYAKKHGSCLIYEGTKSEVLNITIGLAKSRISTDVKSKSIK